MDSILAQIRLDLTQNVDQKTQNSFQRFFKGPVKAYGVKTGTVGKIAKKHWLKVQSLDKQNIFDLCQNLLQSDYTEEAFIVSTWLPNYTAHMQETDFEVFGGWIEKFINNWAKCDSFCNHTMGNLIQKYPHLTVKLLDWAKKPNRWLKRAAAVSLIVPAKKGLFLKEALDISNLLLTDKDDMVQKGYGWLLKEESRKHQKQVFDYVVANKKVMPRTALRYAIELMPKDLKLEAMKKQ
jgi:3-methyladenine DNA glycosylase AlkD